MRSLLVRLQRAAFLECLLCSALAVGLWFMRARVSGSTQLGLLVYNLTLAWIPWFLSALTSSLPKSSPRILLLVLGAAWLLFLPNAPYIVTDLVHFHERPPVPLWLDIFVFFSFALGGCLLGFHSVRHMEEVVRERVGSVPAAATALGSLMLCGAGIYLGRYPRLNSWDALLRPGDVVETVLASVIQRDAIAFSVILGAVLVTSYACIRAPWSHPAAPPRLAQSRALPRRQRRPLSRRSSPRAARCPGAA